LAISFFVFQYELCKPPEVGREVDEDFLEQLDVVAGCELPQALKFQISELVEKHCQMSGLSVNLDVFSLGSLSDDLKKLFVKMMNYATNMNSNTKKLVIDLVKAISETPRSDPSSPVDSNVGGGPPFDPPPPPGPDDLPGLCLVLFVFSFLLSYVMFYLQCAFLNFL
jgi:hypothetical protein